MTSYRTISWSVKDVRFVFITVRSSTAAVVPDKFKSDAINLTANLTALRSYDKTFYPILNRGPGHPMSQRMGTMVLTWFTENISLVAPEILKQSIDAKYSTLNSTNRIKKSIHILSAKWFNINKIITIKQREIIIQMYFISTCLMSYTENILRLWENPGSDLIWQDVFTTDANKSPGFLVKWNSGMNKS